MHRKIRELRSIRKRYVETLVNLGDLSIEEAEQALEEFKQRLQQAFDESLAQSRFGIVVLSPGSASSRRL
jgi:2-oxoglutarate dehydrogenase E1 component